MLGKYSEARELRKIYFKKGNVLCLALGLTLCNQMDCSLPGTSVHGDSPGRNSGVGYHALLQGILPTQRSNPGILHGRWILYHLSHQEAQEFLNGQLIPSPGDLPDPRIKLGSPALQADSLPAELPGKLQRENAIVFLK